MTVPKNTATGPTVINKQMTACAIHRLKAIYSSYRYFYGKATFLKLSRNIFGIYSASASQCLSFDTYTVYRRKHGFYFRLQSINRFFNVI